MLQSDGSINLIERDITGGKITKETIDTIQELTSHRLKISGLKQDTFEYLIWKYGNRFLEITFWKCPRIEDFSPLESLGRLQRLDFFWNQKANRFWNLAKNPNLKALSFNNFVKTTCLSTLGSSTSLEKLEFGNSCGDTSHVESLEPIGAITTLKELAFSPKKIVDAKAEPLTRLPNLKALHFSNRLFSTEKIAWLVARLPPGLESNVLTSFIALQPGQLAGVDTLIVGRGKPFLDSVRDKDRLAKYVSKFEALVAHFRSNPSLGEPD
jgi:hypothetical protein